MGDAVRVKYKVVVEVDPDVWQLNYGVDRINEDIESMMSEVIAEQINLWFTRTGNTGYARVSKL